MPDKRKNWLHIAGLTWPKLVAAAKNETTLRYGELAASLGMHHRSMRWALDPIHSYCIEAKLPPLTALVVNATGTPGPGFIAWDLTHIEDALDAVWRFNWELIRNPFEQLGPADSIETMAGQILNKPDRAVEVYRLVPDRGISQKVFREALIHAYGSRCAFCGCSFVQALEAAHIKRWSESLPEQRLDPRNGLLLCATHHRLFDGGIISLTSDHKLSCLPGGHSKFQPSDIDEALTSALHGKTIFLPKREGWMPLGEYIVCRKNYRLSNSQDAGTRS